MKNDETPQTDMFASPTFDVLGDLLDSDGNPSLIIIGCGKSKQPKPSKASKLYTSRRFKKSVSIAENLSSPYQILSGLHGLLAPSLEIAPYELELSKQPQAYKERWAHEALLTLNSQKNKKITILADKQYASEIIKENQKQPTPLNIRAPFLDIEEHHIQDWLDQAERMSARIRDLKELYSIISTARESGKTFRLSELKNSKLPERGVYIFIDPRERNFMGNHCRVVRIGTHAVSSGSKATLRNRLRNHLGKQDGLGNHRGSIFRLHVGRAIMEASNIKSETWGIGQDADSSTRKSEEELEKRASAYLRDLEVFIVPIPDTPSKNSMRAAVETQLIALFSEDLHPIDKPSATWLGRKSPNTDISSTGLWNLRDIGKRYTPSGKGSVSELKKILSSENERIQ